MTDKLQWRRETVAKAIDKLHTNTKMNKKVYPGEDAFTFISKLEEYGLRVFHQEINRHAPLWGSEFALIQKFWTVFEEEKNIFKNIV